MKTRYIKMDWLIPVLGIAVVAGSLVAGSTYLNLERKTHADEVFMVTLDRLYQAQKLSAVLKTFHDGDAAAAVKRLDLLLCANIIRTDSEMACADARTQDYVQFAFRRIALLRPRTGQATETATAEERYNDETAAQRILDQTLASQHIAQAK